MSVSTRRAARRSAVLSIGFGLGAVVSGQAAAQDVERYQVTGDKVAIYDIAGVATIEAGSGSAVVVEVRRGGKDAGRLKIEQGSIDGTATLRVVYPDDEIVYRPAGGKWDGSSSTTVRDDGTFGDGSRGGRRVAVRSSGSGMEAWADLKISVPRGQRIAVHLLVGALNATAVNGTLTLDAGAANATATGTSGSLSVDVGSGDVRVQNATGDLTVDTGSGDVWLGGTRDGDLRASTGSGNVTIDRVAAGTVRVETGSGDVDGTGVTADNLTVDTGSGDVELAFDGAPKGLTVETGSGDVVLALPSGYGASVELETSSGRLSVEFPLRVNVQERDRVSGVIGNGTGRLQVETGSGDIEIRQR